MDGSSVYIVVVDGGPRVMMASPIEAKCPGVAGDGMEWVATSVGIDRISRDVKLKVSFPDPTVQLRESRSN